MKPEVPGLGRLIWRDHIASLSARILVGTWLCTLALEVVGRLAGGQAATIAAFGVPNLIMLSIVLTVIFAPMLLLRLWMLTHVLGNGRPVKGEVVSYDRKGPIERVVVRYTVDSVQHDLRNTVKSTRSAAPTQVGQPVTVMLDPNDAKRGFVYDLYASGDA